MELNTDLAKALFDKVITPIKDKMKRPITNIIVNKDEDKSDLENLISLNQENANELPPPPDTIMRVDTDTITPITNNILNIDEGKSELENLPLTIQENPNVLPPYPDTKEIKPIDIDISEPIKESVSDIDEYSPPPPGPNCRAREKEIDVAKDCYLDENTMTVKPTRIAQVRYHPDSLRNQDCREYADTKFKELTNKCEKYSPPATPRPPTEQPATPRPPTEQLAAPQPSSTEQPVPQPSSIEQPEPEPSVEVVQELPNDNKAIKQLVQALISVLRKPATQAPIPEQPATPFITIEPSVEVVQDLPKDNKAIKQLVQALISVLRKPASQPPITEQQVTPIPSTEKIEETKDIASCDINETCEEQPLKPLVNALSNMLSTTPATGPSVSPSVSPSVDVVVSTPDGVDPED